MTPARAIAIFMLSLIVIGCRKGEHDPLVSLNTRKARLTNQWKIKSGRATLNYRFRTTNGNHFIYNESFTFTETGYKLFTNESGSPFFETGSYSLSLDIDKDGKFRMTESRAGRNFKATGSWAFTTGIGKEKESRESVTFILDAVSSGSFFGHIFNRLSTTFTYDIIELRSKKIVLNAYGKVYMNDYGDYITCSTEYELVP